MGTITVPPGTEQQYYPTVQAGNTPDEVVITVDPSDPNTYVIYFEDENVFNEKVKLLKKGKNTFKRKAGSTATTTFSITALDTPGIREIPPR